MSNKAIRNRLNAQRSNSIVVGGSDRGEIDSLKASLLFSGEDAVSSVVLDASGKMYTEYKEPLEREGFAVLSLNYDTPANSPNGFNPFAQLHSFDDYVKMADRLVRGDGDKFCTEAENIVMKAAALYIAEEGKGVEPSINGLCRFLSLFDPDALEKGETCNITKAFELHRDRVKESTGKDSESYAQFKKLLKMSGRAVGTTVMYALADLNALDTPELREMMSKSDFDLTSTGQRKTVVFVNVSDFNRSNDAAVSLFFDMLLDRLCAYADSLPEKRLPIPVRLILDGFGTTVRIPGFERTISGLNRRGISAILAVKSLAQLEQGYGSGARIILANCPVKAYFGGSDPDTARVFTELTNKPLEKLLNMPPLTYWLVRQGEEAVCGKLAAPDDCKLLAPDRENER